MKLDDPPTKAAAKPGLSRNKVMLCVWWDCNGIFQSELLPCESLLQTADEAQTKN